MANTKISALSTLATPAAADLLVVVDVSDTTMAPSGTDKSLTVATMFAVPQPYGATTPAPVSATSLTSTLGVAAAGTVSSGSPGVVLDGSVQAILMGGITTVSRNGGTGEVTIATNADKVTVAPVAANAAQFDNSAVAGNTRMLLFDVDNGTMERVTVGAADSGGVGFKVLRIPN